MKFETFVCQGGTIKFLVDLLGIDRKSDVERLISEEVNDTVMEHMMAGIEIISGKRGHQYIGVSPSIKIIIFSMGIAIFTIYFTQ